MAYSFLDLFGLSGSDPCLDVVPGAADWGAQHPQQFGQAITTAVTAPFGVGAIARAESGLEGARTANDWLGGVTDQGDLNQQIGAWAAPGLSALGAWGACHIDNSIGAWGAAPAQPAGVDHATDGSAAGAASFGATNGYGVGDSGVAQGPFDAGQSSVWSAPAADVAPSFGSGWSATPTVADWHAQMSAVSSQVVTPASAPGGTWSTQFDSAPSAVSSTTVATSTPTADNSGGSASASGHSSASSTDSGSTSHGGSSGSGGI